jgi:rhodanese-related sulfurtransferase/DNA-directed RNA polymerase subunit RPC12/RpoP
MIYIRSILLLVLFSVSSENLYSQSTEYVCLPCGLDCDNAVHKEPGQCMHCGMGLVKKSTVVFNRIEPDALCSYVASHPGVILLDVRSKREFEGKSTPDYGTLKNAINIPIQEMDKRITELDAYKNKEIIVYCSHSQRSSRVSYQLTQNGFTKVTNMQGGLRLLKDDSCKK